MRILRGRPRRAVLAGIAAIVAATVAGCSADPDPMITVSGDCTQQIRADGVVYSSYASSDRAATKLAKADESDCHDLGPDAAGAVFSDSPRQVTTWRFGGHSPSKVVGVRSDDGSFGVFVADSVPADERDEIHADLAKARR